MSNILVADCGGSLTTVALIGQAGGRHRIVACGEAPSTHGPPKNDASLGLLAAIRRIEEATGTPLLAGDGRWPSQGGDGRCGIDVLALVSNAAEPLRVVLAGLTEEHSLAAARGAVAGCAATVMDVVSCQDRLDVAHMASRLAQARPDLIVVVGGTQEGATAPILSLGRSLAACVATLPREARPAILYAGRTALAGQVTALFGQETHTAVLPNVTPAQGVVRSDPLRWDLDEFYRKTRLRRLPGMAKLSAWSDSAVVPTHRSLDRTFRYVGERYGLNVLGLSIGGTTAVVAESRANRRRRGTPWDDGTQRTQALVVEPGLGVGQGTVAALDAIPMKRIVRWLHFDMEESAARRRLLNMGFQPAMLPPTEEDMYLQQALAREIGRMAMGALARDAAGAPGGAGARNLWDLAAGTGRFFGRVPSYALAALVMLDCLEPRGVCTLAVDFRCVAGALGALAAVAPAAAAEVVENGAWLTLGTVVAPCGMDRPGEIALRVRMATQDGQELEETVNAGSIKVIPLGAGVQARLDLCPASQARLGSDRPGRRVRVDVQGGALGIIVDARGRPLRLAETKRERQKQVAGWLLNLGIPVGLAEKAVA